jgi:hypothetical protein
MNAANAPTTIVISHEEALTQQTNRLYRLQNGILTAHGFRYSKDGSPKAA